MPACRGRASLIRLAGRCLLPLLLGLLLSACDDKPQPLSGLQFARVWQDSYEDPAVSWWYLGEDDEYYHLARRRPDSELQYLVPRAFIVISGIARTRGGAVGEPVRITTANLEFM